MFGPFCLCSLFLLPVSLCCVQGTSLQMWRLHRVQQDVDQSWRTETVNLCPGPQDASPLCDSAHEPNLTLLSYSGFVPISICRLDGDVPTSRPDPCGHTLSNQNINDRRHFQYFKLSGQFQPVGEWCRCIRERSRIPNKDGLETGCEPTTIISDLVCRPS